MGNKFSRRRAVVDEKYTRTQGLYQHRDVDPRKLKRLILNGQLAPCFPGAEDSVVELDECPICFLFYPSLNRSKCCTKGICTECFLQIKSPHSARPTQCPFCKTASYVVEYRGEKTTEEKGVEQAEEQKVIEAKIRIRQKELHDEEERMLKQEEDQGQNNLPDRFRRNFSNLHGFTLPTGDAQVQGRASSNELDTQLDTSSDPSFQPTQTCQPETISRQTAVPQTGIDPVSEGVGCQASQASRLSGSSFHRLNRVDDFDLDLEEIMVMEAIWLSIQEQGQTHPDQVQLRRVIDSSRNASDETSRIDNMRESLGTRAVTGRSSVTSGLAGAIAAMVERQVTSSESIATGEQTCVSNLQALENEPGLSHPELLSGSAINLGGEQGHTKEKCQTDEAISHVENSGGQELNNWMQVSVQSERTIYPLIQAESRTSLSDWLQDHSSEAVEVGTSFSSSIPSASDLPWGSSEFLPPPGMESFGEPSSGLPQRVPMLPGGFEEQMMLAMALSLAEAQAQAQGSG